MKTTTKSLLLVIAAGTAVLGLALAGTLDPPGPPAPTMVTLQQIYDVMHPIDACFDNVGRFADCGNGTVKDTVTGLTWLKNANCFGTKDWAAANIAASQLANGQCGLTDGSAKGAWRLPTQAQWQALVKTTCSSPALADKTGFACYAASPWATGVQSSYYQSSTTNTINPTNVVLISLATGSLANDMKSSSAYYVWPVRGGQ